jgi:hypothetical protein
MPNRTTRPPCHPDQIELFAPTHAGSRTAMPAWRSLPDETRRTLTDLMARLILEHAAGERVTWGEEGHDDL